jgi:methyl-accepting chemotaxis protein
VGATEEGAREAARGGQLAQRASDSLGRISAMVDETTDRAAEISIATKQQQTASTQVVTAMADVAEVSRQFATGATDTAKSSEELARLAGQVESSIAEFVTDGRTPQPRVGRPDEGDAADDGASVEVLIG